MLTTALWPSGLGNYFVCKRFAGQTLLWSLEFVIQINEYLYSGYVIGFDIRSTFSLSDGNGFGKNVIIFRVHNSSPAHAEIKKRDLNNW